MTAPVAIPSLGFARGAIVRSRHGTNNMLVIRGFRERTAVIMIESDRDGGLRIHEFATADLVLVPPSGVEEAADVSTRVRP